MRVPNAIIGIRAPVLSFMDGSFMADASYSVESSETCKKILKMSTMHSIKISLKDSTTVRVSDKR